MHCMRIAFVNVIIMLNSASGPVAAPTLHSAHPGPSFATEIEAVLDGRAKVVHCAWNMSDCVL